MKRIILVLLPFFMISCAQENKNSIKLGVEQSIRIPVEYVSVSASLQLADNDPVKVEKEGYEKLSKTVKLLSQLGYERKQLEINSGELRNLTYRDKESYRYTSSIKFDIHTPDKLDTIRRALLKEGINNFSITDYKNTKEDSLYEVAYRQAIQRAREKAQQLIINESVKIGEILNLSENIQETFDIVQTRQVEFQKEFEMDEGFAIESVDPLFNKMYYTKKIEFSIQFALE